MLLWEITAIYSENHMKHINTLCDYNTGLMPVKPGGTYRLPVAVKVKEGFQNNMT
jgi:hypothetical protein